MRGGGVTGGDATADLILFIWIVGFFFSIVLARVLIVFIFSNADKYLSGWG